MYSLHLVLPIRGKATEKTHEQRKHFKFDLFFFLTHQSNFCEIPIGCWRSSRTNINNQCFGTIVKANQLNDVFCELVYDRGRALCFTSRERTSKNDSRLLNNPEILEGMWERQWHLSKDCLELAQLHCRKHPSHKHIRDKTYSWKFQLSK